MRLSSACAWKSGIAIDLQVDETRRRECRSRPPPGPSRPPAAAGPGAGRVRYRGLRSMSFRSAGFRRDRRHAAAAPAAASAPPATAASQPKLCRNQVQPGKLPPSGHAHDQQHQLGRQEQRQHVRHLAGQRKPGHPAVHGQRAVRQQGVRERVLAEQRRIVHVHQQPEQERDAQADHCAADERSRTPAPARARRARRSCGPMAARSAGTPRQG